MAKPGASLVLAGPHQPVVVQLLAYAINSALKNMGKTLIVRERARNPKTRTAFCNWRATWRLAESNSFSFSAAIRFTTRPRALTIDPQTKQQLDWPDLQKRVPDVVRLGYYEDATSSASQWHVPMAHYLESWGDALTADGAYLAIQPMILPLFGGLSEIEMMHRFSADRRLEGPELVQETFRAERRRRVISRRPGRNFSAMDLLRTLQLRDKPPTFNANTAGGIAHTLWAPTPAADAAILPKLFSSAVTRWMMAVTSTTAGSRNCRIRSRSSRGTTPRS